jgi:hypothetical protein
MATGEIRLSRYWQAAGTSDTGPSSFSPFLVLITARHMRLSAHVIRVIRELPRTALLKTGVTMNAKEIIDSPKRQSIRNRRNTLQLDNKFIPADSATIATVTTATKPA